ncbi:membrane protein [Beggiatoa sp. PS]|nr:membrane protein [Beggiatoa sp. PS]
MKEFFTLNKFVVAIVIGALGSAAWEKIGGPLWESISSLFAITISFFFESYIDYLHADIGKGIEGQSLDPFIMFLFYLLLIVILAIPIYNSFKTIGEWNPDPNAGAFPPPPDSSQPLSLGWGSVILSIISIVGILFVTSAFVKSHYNEKAILFVERSIDILSPQLYEQNKGWDEILSLQAQYRAVDNAEKYLVLYQKLNQIAQEQKVTLPSFQSLAYLKKKQK